MHPYNDPNFLTYLKEKQGAKLSPVVPLTTTEEEWLSYMLNQEKVHSFLSSEEKNSLLELLPANQQLGQAFVLKRKPKNEEPNGHLVPLLRSMIEEAQGMTITYSFRTGEEFTEAGIPYKLYFSVQHQSWYVWWMRIEEGTLEERRRRTPLVLIHDVDSLEVAPALHQQLWEELAETVKTLDSLTLRIQPRYEGMDEQWFIQGFSRFQKEVIRKDSTLYMKIYYAPEDEGFLLSQIREFGPHIFVTEPKDIQQKLFQTSQNALRRYQEEKITEDSL